MHWTGSPGETRLALHAPSSEPESIDTLDFVMLLSITAWEYNQKCYDSVESTAAKMQCNGVVSK